ADEVRAKLKVIGPMPDPKTKPSAYEPALKNDAAGFDSVPGAGFNSDPASAAIVPPAGRITGSGDVLVLDPAQNNVFKAINRAWQQGATVQASGGPSGAPIRYTIRGLSADAQDELVKSLALRAERALSAPGRAIRAPRIGLYQPWTGSLDEGWTRWVLEQYGFSFTLVHPEDFKSPLGSKIDVLIIADDARVPLAPGVGVAVAGGGRGGGRGGAPSRPEHAHPRSAPDLQGFEQCVRGRGPRLCLPTATPLA